MIYLVYERESGRVLSHIIADSEPEVMDHHAVIEHDHLPEFETVQVIDGEVVEVIPADYLDDRKRRLCEQVDAARDARLDRGAQTPYGRVQADLASRINISGAVSMALLNPSFTVEWRMGDNTSETLDAAKMVEVGTIVGAFTGATYAQSFAFKDTINAIADLATLRAFEFSFD